MKEKWTLSPVLSHVVALAVMVLIGFMLAMAGKALYHAVVKSETGMENARMRVVGSTMVSDTACEYVIGEYLKKDVHNRITVRGSCGLYSVGDEMIIVPSISQSGRRVYKP